MKDSNIFNFIKKLLSNIHVSSYLLDYSKGKITTDVDQGLRALIYGVDSYENVLINSLSQAKDNVIYRFIDEYHCIYIFLRLNSIPEYFFIGPYLNNNVSEKEVQNVLKKRQTPKEVLEQVVTYYNNLPVIEDENVLIGIVNTFAQTLWGDDENFYMEYVDYPILDSTKPLTVWNCPSTERNENFSLSIIEENYKNEKLLIKAVSKGELHKVNAIASAVFNNGTEERTSDTLRNRKNYLIILNTLLRKASESGGVHPYFIHIFSSKYAKKIENVRSISDSFKLQGEMIREYCIFVRQKSIKKYSYYVGKAITLISYDLTADLNLKSIASVLNVNPSYLSSLFSKECGCTLTDYIHNQRIEESMRQLTQTNKTIMQISTDCGFNDVHYFNRCFKKKNGVTPTEYKSAVKS